MADWTTKNPTRPRVEIERGDRVRLTNPSYPDLQFIGAFVTGSIAGEPHTGVYGTYTVLSDAENNKPYRSEGYLQLWPESEHPACLDDVQPCIDTRRHVGGHHSAAECPTAIFEEEQES